MYFSLITPVRGSELGAARAWNGVYNDHQWLWLFFPGQQDSPRRFLFRRHDDGALARYYVVSHEIPQSPSSDWQVQSKAYAPTPQAGSVWHFELRANPTITISSAPKSESGKKQGVRHDVVMHAKRKKLAELGLREWKEWVSEDKPTMGQLVWDSCSAWITSRAAKIGVEFDLDCLQVDSYQQHRENHKGDIKKNDKGEAVKTQKSLRFSSVDFTGVLRVRDPVLLADALTQGIGHAKGFGCGLLLIRPAN